jgi:uncharacterized protein YdaU (DUF1376 family)
MGIQKPEWFPMDPAKFLSDSLVDSMTTIELGAAFRLLCRQWIDGSLPDDLHLLARLSRLDDAAMSEAWIVLQKFFPAMDPGRRANRYMFIRRETVLAELERRSDEFTRLARKRWDAVRNANGNAARIPDAMPVAMQDQSRAKQTRADQKTSSAEPSNSNGSARMSSPSPESRGRPRKSDAEEIYWLYPRHLGKNDALSAISKAIFRVSQEHRCDIVQAIEYLRDRTAAFAKSPAGQKGKYTPYPATWFNAGHYSDDELEWHPHDAPEDEGNSNHGKHTNLAEQRTENNLAAVDVAYPVGG